MTNKIGYNVNDYFKKYHGKKLSLEDLRGLWMSYGKNLPRTDLCPLADRPSERQCEDSFQEYLENLVNVGLLEETYLVRGKNGNRN